VSNLAQAQAIPKKAAEKAPRQESEFRRVARLMSRFLTGQRRLFVMALVMLSAEAITAIFTAYPLSYLIDYLKGDRPDLLQVFGLPQFVSPQLGTVAALSIAIVLMAMINSAADSMAEIYLARGGRMLGFNLRVGLYDHLQRLSLAFFNQQRTGDILTRVTGDVTALEDFVINSLSDIVGSLLVLFGTLAYLFYRSWEVALVAALIVPFVGLVSNYFAQRIKAASKKQRAREGDLASAAQEMLTSIRVIQTYGRGGNELKRFAQQNQKTMDVALEAAGIQAVFSWVVKVLEALSTVSVIWLGLWLIGQSTISIGTLVLFVILIDQMFKPTKKIIKEWNTFGKMYASAERIGELLDRKPAVQDGPGAVVAPGLNGDIVYQHVSFAYRAEAEDQAKQGEAQLHLALRDINLEIRPGEVVALVGGSGAGKSTVVQLLPRLYDPHAGQVLIDGHDIRTFTLESLRSQMSMVLQETVLFTGSVADNIAYGRDNATREEVIAAAIQANAHEFIEKLPKGYDTELGERAASLSGGQRQRLAIARAFIRNTPILILDEPTTGLDAESTDLVLTALRTLMKGKSTIIISHDLNLIRHADRIVVIKQGQVEQIGTHKQLLRGGGLYAELYHKQFGQAVEEQVAQVQPVIARPAPQHLPDEVEEEDEGEEPVTPEVFQTLMTQALPQPASPKTFETLLMQAVPLANSAPAARQTAAPTPPAPVAPPAAAPAAPGTPDAKPRPAIFQTTLMHTLPPSASAPAPEQQGAEPPLALSVGEAPASQPSPREAVAPQPQAASRRLEDSQLDPRHSPILQQELPGLQTAFDDQAMQGYLQTALFGKANARFTIARCEPSEAGYLPDGTCLLRYDIEVQDGSAGQPLQTLVSARIFRDQLACAVYLRDKLAPLAALMRGRPEVAPFATAAMMIEPLNMVVCIFPIDGELPALVGATDRERMVEIFGETLPEALADSFEVERCDVELVDYARRKRAVLRYQVEGRRPGKERVERRTVYGKVFGDNIGALAGPVTAALRERVAGGDAAYRINVPQTYGWRPDLQLSLLEAIPGEPVISDMLKARLRGKPAPAAGLSLEQMIDACGRIAALLHGSNIKLGRRRTLDDELAAMREELEPIQRISPALGIQLQRWMEQLETYAEQSDSLPLCFSHGDFTHGQLIFDGPTAGLVDFDSVCQAEPALDLGQFLAYLRLADKKKDQSSDPTGELIEQLSARFMETYLAATGERVEDADRLRVRVSVYKVISMLRRTMRSWQKLKGSRTESALAILEEEIACLPQLDY
jgi:ABC-type multidrug transport system fused ATPase/permease subunit